MGVTLALVATTVIVGASARRSVCRAIGSLMKRSNQWVLVSNSIDGVLRGSALPCQLFHQPALV